MKKLLLILLIFALFLTGCSAPAPAAGNENSNDNPNNESAENVEGNENPDDNQNTKPTEKVPATQITNEGQPQDESADFLFVFKGRNGYFARGERMELDVDVVNNTGATHWYYGASSYRADIKLVSKTNTEYVILPFERPDTDDAVWREIEAGESSGRREYIDVPEDAPLGEYTLVCRYQTTRTEFKGYFTLTQ